MAPGLFIAPGLLLLGLIAVLIGQPNTAIAFWAFAIPVHAVSGIAAWLAITHFRYEGLRLVSLVTSAILTIIIFSRIYAGGLIHFNDCDQHLEWPDAIYYSMVTFTTLGYGDMYPTDKLRLIAASEAVLGYLYLGLLIAMVSNYRPVLRHRSQANEKGNALTTDDSTKNSGSDES